MLPFNKMFLGYCGVGRRCFHAPAHRVERRFPVSGQTAGACRGTVFQPVRAKPDETDGCCGVIPRSQNAGMMRSGWVRRTAVSWAAPFCFSRPNTCFMARTTAARESWMTISPLMVRYSSGRRDSFRISLALVLSAGSFPTMKIKRNNIVLNELPHKIRLHIPPFPAGRKGTHFAAHHATCFAGLCAHAEAESCFARPHQPQRPSVQRLAVNAGRDQVQLGRLNALVRRQMDGPMRYWRQYTIQGVLFVFLGLELRVPECGRDPKEIQKRLPKVLVNGAQRLAVHTPLKRTLPFSTGLAGSIQPGRVFFPVFDYYIGSIF